VSLRRAWDRQAADWRRFSQGPDAYAWLFNLPAFLELVPAPGGLTLDVGCGEGRVARELIARGHRVVGIDSSPELVDAAANGDPPVEAIVADAAEVPLEDGIADLAVAFMVLQSVDDLDAVVGEMARLLEPGGRLCLAVLHPVNSMRMAPSWFTEHRVADRHEHEGAGITFHDVHRPLSAYFGALEATGMAVEALREPVPGPELLDRRPDAQQWTRTPCFLHLRAMKPGVPFPP
jgi:SAM-dependent methyltransferase